MLLHARETYLDRSLYETMILLFIHETPDGSTVLIRMFAGKRSSLLGKPKPG